MNELIRILHDASDRYGYPYVIGFMEQYNLSGLCEATEEQLTEYIRQEGL